MLDFLMVSARYSRRGELEIRPRFTLNKSSDLMIRGGDFYAIWIEEKGLWSTDEQDAIMLIDKELDDFLERNKAKYGQDVKVAYMWDAESGTIDKWHKFCQSQKRDSYHTLDEKLIFSNTKSKKTDYASKTLTYPLEAGDMPGYEKLISTLYSEEERHKIEWAIGSIVSGDSKKLQKFLVLYGGPGTGKGTILDIIKLLFDGYDTVFDAKSLGSGDSFALEPFKNNPLVGIQYDGDLSRIEDNTLLNSLVSHETIMVNEKFKSRYSNKFKSFLFMGTNKPVKITDAKSGLIRRLIDVSPSGNKLSSKEYNEAKKQVEFELGAIAKHCLDIYKSNPNYYDDYIPTAMLEASNDFYNFVADSYLIFKNDDGVTMKSAWEMYKTYCDEAKVPHPFPQRIFREELKNYFREYKDRYSLEDGTRVRSYFSGFKTEKFEVRSVTAKKEEPKNNYISFEVQASVFDKECADCLAQYASSKETPSKKWDQVKTKLTDISTSRLHYVQVPENHIIIDFDIPDENGNKCFEKNLEEASKWPPTYAELSKSGAGIHLHYIYTGDPSKLSRIFDDHIEIKVFTGNSSLRRKLTKCNNLPIAKISSGLPLKGEKMVSQDVIKSEKGLRTLIKRNLNKEIHPGTKPSIDFIYKILEDAHASGLHYDVSDMRNAILAFAANSTHQSEYCIKLVNKMPFRSEEASEGGTDISDDSNLVFYDVEVFPNLFLVCWKVRGEGKPVVRMFNPTPEEIEELIKFKLVGFNCRRYDNHIMYARLMGYSNEELYRLSQRIINNSPNCYFSEAYNLSYTDIYDFASAGNKKSLKKLEIEMGIHHQELGFAWDKPVPEELWPKVADYCDNDVEATEASFDYLAPDWTARQILADLAGMTVNDTTNSLTQRIIFGKNRKPQDQFNYRNLAEPVTQIPEDQLIFLQMACPDMVFQKFVPPSGMDIRESYLPYFPGYEYKAGVSTYRGETVGEGGYVYAEPGMYTNVALLDISSMHPHSTIAEVLFGVKFTKAFRDIVEGRVSIKHEAWQEVNQMLEGRLTPYIQLVLDGKMTSKSLANALKTAINAVYGLTAANFDNPFRDPRNKDNIVAKRGALFMIDLKHEVQKRGYTVAHIKTDSIKIPNATPEIIEFVMEFGRKYGYSFEHEATYERMCLVNDAVYVARYSDGTWTATGTQFQIPYVFKTLFSKEPLIFSDFCETKSVSSALYLDMNEDLPDVTEAEKKLEKCLKKDPIDTDEVDILEQEIAKGHNLIFIGKVGLFCPIKPGKGGGYLMREQNGKYYSATGAKGYRWLEAETVKILEKEKDIDKRYYKELADEAIRTISEYGDYNWFVSGDPLPNDIPPWELPCGTKQYKSCTECPNYQPDNSCKLGNDIFNTIKK